MAVVTPTDRPKSVRNRYVIEVFGCRPKSVSNCCVIELFGGVFVFLFCRFIDFILV